MMHNLSMTSLKSGNGLHKQYMTWNKKQLGRDICLQKVTDSEQQGHERKVIVGTIDIGSQVLSYTKKMLNIMFCSPNFCFHLF